MLGKVLCKDRLPLNRTCIDPNAAVRHTADKKPKPTAKDTVVKALPGFGWLATCVSQLGK